MNGDYNLHMKTMRQQILDYIRTHRAVTVAEISQAFQMTQANARHHIASLTEQGLLQVIEKRPAPGKGRPARLFAISDQILGDNLDLLGTILLDQIVIGEKPEQLDRILQQMAAQLAIQMSTENSPPGDQVNSTTSLRRRLYRATEIMNQRHYQARWEARPDAPRLVLGHCPFFAIVRDHPELCKLDAYLIEQLTGASAEQTAKLAKDSAGLRFCMFRIGKERV